MYGALEKYLPLHPAMRGTINQEADMHCFLNPNGTRSSQPDRETPMIGDDFFFFGWCFSFLSMIGYVRILRGIKPII
jgi:hypothetical protein